MYDWILYLIIIILVPVLCRVLYRMGYRSGARQVLNDWRSFNEETEAFERDAK